MLESDKDDMIGNDYGEELSGQSSKSRDKIELTSDKPKSSINSYK